MSPAHTISDTACHISASNKQQFAVDGFLMLPAFIDREHQQRLRDDVDLMQSNRDLHGREQAGHLIDYNELGLLTSEPKMIACLKELLGDSFAMHHIHAVRQDAGAAGVHWHHDYEQYPQSNRSHTMVHVFYYLNGLNGEVGDLLVLPGSHTNVMERSALSMFHTNDLPGSLCINDVPNGTAIIVNSAVFHARRPQPGGEDHSRYFIDISYCQAGIQWPGYGNYQGINKSARNNHCSRNGESTFLYDDSFFFPAQDGIDYLTENNSGSLCQRS